jgi:hypothetical protein
VCGQQKAMFSLTFGPAFPDMDSGDRRTDYWLVFTSLSRPGLAFFCYPNRFTETLHKPL